MWATDGKDYMPGAMEDCERLALAYWDILNGTERAEMIAHVYHNGKHTQLKVTVTDLNELIYRCGWTVAQQIDGLTYEAKREIQRLESLPYLSGIGGPRPIDWWKARVVSEEDALTPDM
jgi:hypothetical protein